MYAEYAEHDATTPDRRAFVEHTGRTGPAEHTARTETGSQS